MDVNALRVAIGMASRVLSVLMEKYGIQLKCSVFAHKDTIGTGLIVGFHLNAHHLRSLILSISGVNAPRDTTGRE